MIAIPMMRGRVAPVLNWCSRTMIFPVNPGGKHSGTLDAGVRSIGAVAVIAASVCGADIDLRGFEFGFAELCGWVGGEGYPRCSRRY